jgi:Kyakuja-Dileera-Zisupton transposase
MHLFHNANGQQRYINMDYLFWSSVRHSRLRHSSLTRIVVSYDIACQWSKYIWERLEKYRRWIEEDEDRAQSFVFLVPKFHLPAHIAKCHTSYSFNLERWVARTDGEAPERGWADVDPLAPSAKEMGPGSWVDTINAHLGDWNWKKVIAMGKWNQFSCRAEVQCQHQVCYCC